ncbi:MAG: ankyrin repeat domain-containing protein [Comamonadaceae bacterium]|nr:ankyrin repeat domain-containing protein [Comamonadaceae bacterium]
MDFPKTSHHHGLARPLSDGTLANNLISASASVATTAAQPRHVTTGTSPRDDSLQLSRAQSAQDIVCADEFPFEQAEVEITMVFPDEPPPVMAEHDIQCKLRSAARHGDTATARNMAMLLKSPSEINRSHALGDTPLLLAVRNQHTDTVRVFAQLLGAPQELNVFDAVGLTPLMIAARNCDIQTAQVLINAGAAIHTQNPGGFTAIMKAAEQTSDLPHEVLIELLIERLMDSEQIRELA